MDDRSIVVIDASVAIARVRVEEHTPMILGAFRDWSRMGTRLVVPRAFWWEVVNALTAGHRYSGVEVLEAVHELETLEIESRDPDRGSLLLTISAVAERPANPDRQAQRHHGIIAVLAGAQVWPP